MQSREVLKMGKQNAPKLAVVLLIFTVLAWGLSFISTKIVLTQLPPITIAFYRQIIASVFLILWGIVSKTLLRVSLREWIMIMISAFFGIVLYFAFENTGLQYTTAANASMIISALPVFTLLSEAIIYKMKIRRQLVWWIMISIGGVYLLVTDHGGLDFSSTRFIGNSMVLGAMACWVVYTAFCKKLLEKHSTILITTYQSLISIFLFIPFIIPEIKRWPTLTSLSVSVWVNLLFLGIFCSALAYVWYAYAVKNLGATISTVFLNLIPVVTMVTGSFLLGEIITGWQIIGISLILLSLFQLSKPTEHHRKIDQVFQEEHGV